MYAKPPSSTATAGGGAGAPALAATTAETIWGLAWPVIVTLSLESLVGLVDMLMVGRLGAAAVAGVGVGVQILSTVSAGMFALGTGTLALVARHVGGRRLRAAETVLQQSIVAAVGVSLVVVLPVMVWAPACVRAFGVDETVVRTATPFLRLILLGVPADAVLFVVALGLRGAGDTRTPLAVGVVVAAINVVANYVLIFGRLGLPALGVAGSACGSVIAFTSGAALAVTLLRRGGLVLRLDSRGMRPRPEVIRRVLAIGYPAAAEHVLMQGGYYLYIVFAARYGRSPVAAYIIGVRILALSFLPGFGFAAAAGALVGQALGAGRPDDAERSGWAATRFAVWLMTAGGMGIFVAARPIARLFVDDSEVIAAAVSFIRVLAAAQPLMAIDFTLGGALRGAGDTRFPLLAVFVGFYVCRLGFAYLVAVWLGLGLVWLWGALVGDYLARSLLKAYRFRSGRWKLVAV